MSERKFKFVSPGIFIREIDNSQLPAVATEIGPVIIGRTTKGPAMQPFTVNGPLEFTEVFGTPDPGKTASDVWRSARPVGPTYAAYAARAWLENAPSCTVVRLLGTQHDNFVTDSGEAGWRTDVTTPARVEHANGGAFGLFVIDQPIGDAQNNETGVLAAVFYAMSGTYFGLSGTLPNTYNDGQVPSVLNQYVGSSAELKFKLHIRNAGTGDDIMQAFSLKESDDDWLRKVFNTDPTRTNTTVTEAPTANATASYWLGESFEGMVARHVTSSAQYGFLAPLYEMTGSTSYADQRKSMIAARTGWVIPQDLSNDTANFFPAQLARLFRFISREAGEYAQNNYKISITDIKKGPHPTHNPYGTFTVLVRQASDSDGSKVILERFSGCNLNPNSKNYLARKIGDMYTKWNDTTRVNTQYGTYPNISRYIYVDMDSAIENGGGEPEHLPFGFYGQPRYERFAVSGGFGSTYLWRPNHDGTSSTVSSNSADFDPMIGNIQFCASGSTTDALTTVSGTVGPRVIDALVSANASSEHYFYGDIGYLHTYLFPAPNLRISSSLAGVSDPRDAYFGITTDKLGSAAGSGFFDASFRDTLRPLHSTYTDASGDASDAQTVEVSYYFTLDDLRDDPTVGTTGEAIWISGSRRRGDSKRGTADYSTVLDAGFDKFTMALHGGFNGWDIREKEPLRNTLLSGVSSTPKDTYSYTFNTYKRAIDSVADPEVVEMNLLTAPGLTDSTLTDHLLSVCESRADALGIIDLEGDYQDFHESNASYENRVGSVTTTVNNLRTRELNTSYGCAYFPWVKILDTPGSESGATLYVPPSVVALGTFASSEAASELWFAPAGFNRGGLSAGAAGLTVLDVTHVCTSKERDKLYEANVNPIARFPSEGVVIFGQKTLQVTPSALDRINVRRLMIYIKKEVSRMATTILFDQNIQTTWNRFLGLVKPFLSSIQTRFGLTSYRVILDETTTTPDLIDRNILYAKIFLQPARAIEYIALDFTISRTGAAFVD